MMTFGQHLGADQDTCAAAMDIGEVLFERAFTAGGIPVDARDRHTGKQRRQRLLQFAVLCIVPLAIAAAACGSLLLTACGIKGPLHYPQIPKPVTKATAEDDARWVTGMPA